MTAPEHTPADGDSNSPEGGDAVQAGAATAAKAQPGNPLHGLTLEAIVVALHAYYGWDGLGQRIAIRCFLSEPSVASSLKFLRKTPWAREKVESLYLIMLRGERRAQSPLRR